MAISKLGADFQVNTEALSGANGDNQGVAPLADGRIAYTWADASGRVWSRIVDPADPGAGVAFLVKSTTQTSPAAPDIAVLADGRVAVAWTEQNNGDGNGSGIRARIYNPDAPGTFTALIANTSIAGNQADVRLSALADGRLAFTWRDGGGDGNLDAIRTRIYDPGNPSGSADFIVNTTISGEQQEPAVTALADGRVVFTWRDPGIGDGSLSAIRARIYDPANPPGSVDFVVNTTVSDYQQEPAVAALEDGRLVFAWTSNDGGDGSGVTLRARIYDPLNPAASSDFIVNTTTARSQQNPAITVLADGRILFAWESDDAGPGRVMIRARLYDSTDPGASSDFVVNDSATGNQINVDVAALGDGRIAFSWWDMRESGGAIDHVRSAIYITRDTGITAMGDASDETFFGTNFVDSIDGGGGNDAILAYFGNDILRGGSGDDRIIADAGDDRLSGEEGNDRLDGGAGRDMLDGGAGSDALTGGGGNDSIDGGRGVDTASYSGKASQYELAYSFVSDAFTIADQRAGAPDGTDEVTGVESFQFSDRTFTRTQLFSELSRGANDFHINTTTFGEQAEPEVAALADGRIVYTWASLDGLDLDGWAIRGRVYDPANPSASHDFIVNTTTVGDQRMPNVTALDDGRILFTWGDNGVLRARIYDPDAPAASLDFVFSTILPSEDLDIIAAGSVGSGGAATILPDGRIAISWIGEGTEVQETIGSYIRDALYIRVYDPANPGGSTEFKIFEARNLDGTGIAALDDGRLAVTTAIVPIGGHGVRQFIIDLSDLPTSVAGGSVGRGTQPSVAALPDGRAIFVWQDNGIHARIYNPGPGATFTDFQVNTTLPGPHADPAVAVLADGRAVITWHDRQGDGSQGAIRSRILDAVNYVDVSGATSGQTVNLSTADLHPAVTDIIGSDFADTLTGNEAANRIAGREGDDHIVGLDGDDKLHGHDGNDTLEGGEGNDALYGGAGANTMSGGGGNDTYIVKSSLDVINEASAGGIDSVTSDVSWVLGPNIENLTLGGAAPIDGAGNVAANQISGNAGNNLLQGDAGDDTLNGGAGDDTLNGGAGDDRLAGDAGNDQLVGGGGNDGLNGGAGNDVLNGASGLDTADYATASGAVTINLGLLGAQNTGGGGADTLVSIEHVTGSGHSDTMLGNNRDNHFAGAAGNDVLDGRIGNDRLDGGAGNDRLLGGDGNDLLLGGANEDRLAGGAGNDQLTGGGGSEVLLGGAGNDILDGGSDGDTADYSDAGAGVTVLLGLAGSQDTGGGGFDTLVSIEHLTGSGHGDSLYGNVRDNRMFGGGGNDLLAGGVGNDVLFGEGGDDRLVGGAGNDNLLGGTGNDTLTGEDGNDTLQGEDGHDYMVGGAGNDTLYGGAGNDQIFGGLGNDALVGGLGSNRLDGGDGADRLFGEAGGATTFVFASNVGLDSVFGFATGAHKLLIDISVFGGAVGAFTFTGNATPAPPNGTRAFLYDTDDGRLYFDADGNGAGARVQILQLAGASALAAGDILLF